MMQVALFQEPHPVIDTEIEKRLHVLNEQYMCLSDLLKKTGDDLDHCLEGSQKRQGIINTYQEIKDKMEVVNQEWNSYKGGFSNVEYAYYSEEAAMQNGYSICPLLTDSHARIKVTHTFKTKDPAEASGLQFRGVVETGSMRKSTHNHLPGKMSCQRCFYKHNFGRTPYVTTEESPLTNERDVKKYKS